MVLTKKLWSQVKVWGLEFSVLTIQYFPTYSNPFQPHFGGDRNHSGVFISGKDTWGSVYLHNSPKTTHLGKEYTHLNSYFWPLPAVLLKHQIFSCHLSPTFVASKHFALIVTKEQLRVKSVTSESQWQPAAFALSLNSWNHRKGHFILRNTYIFLFFIKLCYGMCIFIYFFLRHLLVRGKLFSNFRKTCFSVFSLLEIKKKILCWKNRADV